MPSYENPFGFFNDNSNEDNSNEVNQPANNSTVTSTLFSQEAPAVISSVTASDRVVNRSRNLFNLESQQFPGFKYEKEEADSETTKSLSMTGGCRF